MSSSTSLSLTGTIGGVKISDLINVQDTANRAQAATLTTQEAGINLQTQALTAIQTSLNTLYSTLGVLAKTSLYESKAGSLANPALGTVSVNSSAATNGTWDINVLQVATSSLYVGQKASTIPSGSATVDSIFGSAALGTIRVGTVSGGAQQTITISSGETLDQVAAAINGALSGSGGSASYDSTTGTFTVNGGDSLLLSAGTSNFLQQAQLFNNYSIRSGASNATFVSGSATTMGGTGGYFGTSFVGGSMVINGISVNVASTDTIDDVMDHIQAQTGLQASIVNGQLTINSTTPVTLAAGTGSFLQQAGLTTSTATTTTSQNPIGALNPAAAFGTAGSITINGTTVNYSATDTLNSLLQNITNSKAGVVAVYDSYHDRIGFVSDSAGPQAITITGVTGPLANYGIVDSGTGTEIGTFTAGNSAVVSVNGGTSITSDSNTFTSDMLGIAGLTFNAAAVGDTTVTINPDVSTIESAIDAFVVQYNATQVLLAQYTDPNGVTTINPDGTTHTSPPGLLVNDSTVNQIGFQLRQIFGSALYGNTSASIRTLSDIGIEGNANDNTATTSETSLLTDALTYHLNDVLNVFANPLNGLYSKLSNVLIMEAAGGASIIGTAIANNNKQVSDLEDQINTINEQADAQKLILQQEYANYESAFSISQSTSSYLNANSSGGANSSSSGSNTTSGVL